MKEERNGAREPPADCEDHVVWTCRVPGCGEAIEDYIMDQEAICFEIIDHLVRKHGFSKADVLAYDPLLKEAVEACGDFPTDRD